jgi:hypothetical protein
MEAENAMVVFEGENIRRHRHQDHWYFVVTDIVRVLTNTPNPSDYIKKMRRRDEAFNEGWGQIVTPLKIATSGGPQLLNCVDTENAFRLIQSIPSQKAEPFKRWLAKVGYERVQEIQDPELAQKRMKMIYRAKGYSDEWIEKRVRGIAIRDELTDEWKNRDVKTPPEFAILTAEISKATFGITPSEYRKVKGIDAQNLRDHMNDLELIFTMLGEASTTKIARKKDAQGFDENKIAANEGGSVAGIARTALEEKTGESVVSKENYLKEVESKKRLAMKT